MNLESLKGKHVLTGVDFLEVNDAGYYNDEPASICRFELDGVTYCAKEDPKDGYRSCMEEVSISGDRVSNQFPPHDVVCKYIYQEAGGANEGECDILEIIDSETGLTISRIGTIDTDDYYPCFVANFNPAALYINQAKD